MKLKLKLKMKLQIKNRLFYTYLSMCLMKKYIFNIVEIVEITTNIANEICKDTSDSTEIKKIH